MVRFEFRLNLSTEDVLVYYRGSANQVQTRCVDGRTVQFPALFLKPFLTSAGVRGQFVLTCNDDGTGSTLTRS